MSNDRVECVARAMCQADGNDPDEQIETGGMETVHSGRGLERRSATKAAWEDYERKARVFIAALDAACDLPKS
jgi:hypothetical protein